MWLAQIFRFLGPFESCQDELQTRQVLDLLSISSCLEIIRIQIFRGPFRAAGY